jgi:hypothetical protein
MKKYIYVCLIFICFICAFILSCATYPDLSGDWEITSFFCEPDFIGLTCTITQDEGDIEVMINEAGLIFSGTIDEDGNILISGFIEEGVTISMTGTYTGGNSVSLAGTITGIPISCIIELERT